MKKVIVTGGAGFIGSHIVDALVDGGYDVHIVDNLYAGNKENINPKAVFHNVDIRDYNKLVDIFKDTEYVFHEAALPQVQYSMENPIETNDVNVNGTINVLEACRVNKVKRLIFASSSAIYGDQEILPIKEDSIKKPLSPYGAQKYIGEVYCELYSRIYNLETVMLRYFNVYGPRQSGRGVHASVISRFMDFKKNGQPLTIVGDGNHVRSYVYVRDIAHANMLAMTSTDVGKSEYINIASNSDHSVNDIARLLGGDVVYVDQRIEPKISSADIQKAKDLIGWSPSISLSDGIVELKKYNSII